MLGTAAVYGTIIRGGVKTGKKNDMIRVPLSPVLPRASKICQERTHALPGQQVNVMRESEKAPKGLKKASQKSWHFLWASNT